MNVQDQTRQLTVFICDVNNTVSGSGVLYYSQGDSLFVFTCAHVVDDMETIRLLFLKPINADKDEYQAFNTEVSHSQIVYSPNDEITLDALGNRSHSEDIAIIKVKKPLEFDIVSTDYYLGESSRNNTVFIQGYPKGMSSDCKEPIQYLDCLNGKVLANPGSSNHFTVRMTDTYLDQGNRIYELKGLSGGPVWDGESDKKSLVGVISSAFDETALLSKVIVSKIDRIRSLMKDRFDITIERRINDIPEEDVAGAKDNSAVVNNSVSSDSLYNKWIEEQTSLVRCDIDDLKLQKAIDDAIEAIEDSNFIKTDKDSQKRLMQYLLYCYEIADLDDDYDLLEKKMCKLGFFKKYDTVRHLTKSFMRKRFEETITIAEDCINDKDNCEKKTLVAIATVFLLLSKAYTEDLPVEETIGKLLNEKEDFVYGTENTDDASFIYQMIGYVYGEKYHDYINSVRFLNRSYRVGFDNVVLESLGSAYYFLGIADAVRDDDTVDLRLVDRKALYKARECFLIILSKADELFWSGTIRRIGVIIYNTFVFLNDNYRTLTIYQDLKKYLSDEVLDDSDHANKALGRMVMSRDDFWRDIEIKDAKIQAQSGSINLNDYPHIRRLDRILLETIAKSSKCCNLIEDATARLNSVQINKTGLDIQIRNSINEIEQNLLLIDRRERTPIYVQLINLYGQGMIWFGWNKIDRVKKYYERIRDCGNPELLEAMQNFIFELEAPLDKAIERFKATFDRNRTLQSWFELNHLYIRHRMMDQADEMYRELITSHKDMITDEPEYIYRAYMDYVTIYHRDLKDAIRCYLDAKKDFDDTDIESFWELDLMAYTNTFNDPERFETERKSFMERDLITEEQYHRTAFIAYLLNLDKEKASIHEEYIKQYPHIINPINRMVILQPEELHYLNWIGQLKPDFLPPQSSMTQELQNATLRNSEKQSRIDIDRSTLNQFKITKTAAMDAWSLYILAEANDLCKIDQFNKIYVTHLTIARLLDELSQTDNTKIRELLDHIRTSERIEIRSAGLQSQLDVRENVAYSEPASTIAIALEKDCLPIIGEIKLQYDIKIRYKNKIISIDEINELLENRKR